MQHRLRHQVVGAAQLGFHELLDASHPVADIGGEGSVAEVDTRHHRRRSPHEPNILVSMHSHADVVVVGAGPAGSAAAAWAARAGHDVLVIDAANFPRDKAGGGGLAPRAGAALERLGLGAWMAAWV